MTRHGGVNLYDQAATRALVKEYYEPMWGFAKSTLVSGSDAPSCALHSN